MLEEKKPLDVEKKTNEIITDEFSEIIGTLGGFKVQMTMLQNQMRGLEKTVNKQLRIFQREAKKNRNKGNRKPSGFAVPTNITDELCEFLGKPSGTKIARTEVTQHIIDYIKKNELQDTKSKKCIVPDNKLDKLLNVPNNEKVTYFNIQRYMNKHFVKAE